MSTIFLYMSYYFFRFTEIVVNGLSIRTEVRRDGRLVRCATVSSRARKNFFFQTHEVKVYKYKSHSSTPGITLARVSYLPCSLDFLRILFLSFSFKEMLA